MFDFLSFPWKKNVDPLANPKAAALWLKGVRLGDVFTSHQAIIETLEKFNNDSTVLSKSSLDALLLIDEQSQEIVEMLSQQYVLNPRMSKVIETRLWDSIVSFCRQMVRSYQQFIQNAATQQDHDEVEPHLALIMARSLHYLALEAKFYYFRYENPDEKLWKATHQIYRLSEVKDCDSDPLKLYSGSHLTTSCADEYIQLMMLSTLNSGAFAPRQLEMVDSWLDVWSRQMTVERKLNASTHIYYVALTEACPARKLNGLTTTEMHRFWGSAELIGQIRAAIEALQKGSNGANLGLGDDCRGVACVELLQELESIWAKSSSAKKRRGDRRKVMKMIDVVHGMSDISVCVKTDVERLAEEELQREKSLYGEDVDHDELMDMRQYGFVTKRTRVRQQRSAVESHSALLEHAFSTVQAETWIVENESDGGYGALVQEAENDWVRLGMLVGLRTDEEGRWQIGVIRRLTKVQNDQMYAGIQVLSSTPVTIQLRSPNEPVVVHSLNLNVTIDGIDSVGAILPKIAIFVPYQRNEDTVNTVLLQSADYTTDRVYQVISQGKQFSIRLKESIEKGVDWTWAAVDVMSKDSAF